MIAFHLVLSAYGFWLPNDPRGSWSDFVGSWELLKFGPPTTVNGQRSYAKVSHNVDRRREAKQSLKYPAVRFNEAQRSAIGEGFAIACKETGYQCFACHVGHDHAHLVIGRHPREISVIAGQLKSSATRALAERGIHPLGNFVGKRGGPPTPWSEGNWNLFIDTEGQLAVAIDYVERHAEKEGLAFQRWGFLVSR